MGETFWAKLIASLIAALGMYWMRVPHAVVILMIAQALALFTGSVVAFVRNEFKKRKLLTGILVRIIAYPLLAICDLAEEPLHLTFHLDAYAAMVLFGYEFISIIQNYAKVRPLPKIIQVVADKFQEYLSTSPPLSIKLDHTVTRVEIEPTPDRPNPPAPIVTTVTHEAQTIAKTD